MLQPTKHSKADQTVIAVSTQVLKRLRAKRVIDFDDLRSQVEKSTPGTGRLFIPALNLLYLLGVLDYRPKTDSFEYVGKG